MKINKEELLKYKTNEDMDLICNKVNDFMDYVYQNDLYEYTDDILDNNAIEDYIENNVKKDGWERIKYMLESIENVNYDYLIVDGYGNLKNITNKDLNYIIDDIIYDLDNSKEDYEL